MKEIIRVREKTVHVVFIYLSRSQQYKGTGEVDGVTQFFLPIRDITFTDDVTVVFLLGVSSMS
jgi:hypothetical protein